MPTATDILGPPPPAGEKRTAADILGPPPPPTDIDMDSGLSFQDQTALAAADNLEEKRAYLKNVYGKDFGEAKGADGQPILYVTREGKKVGAEGGPWWKRTGADAIAKGPEMVGMAGGAIVGAAGGPPGIVAGAAGGAMVGKGAEEALKAGRGYYKKDFKQGVDSMVEAGEGGIEGELGGRAISGVIGKVAKGGLPRAITGATEDSENQFARLKDAGARPPIQSTAPDMKKFQRMSIMAQKLSGEASSQTDKNRVVLETEAKKILQNSGVPKPHVDAAYADMQSGVHSATGEEPAEAIQARVRAHADMLEGQAKKTMDAAEKAVDAQQSHFDALIKAHPAGALGVDVPKGLIEAKRGFSAAAGTAYGKVDELLGGQPVVPMSQIRREAQRIVKLTKPVGTPGEAGALAKGGPKPPGAPDISAQPPGDDEALFKSLGIEMPKSDNGMMTFGQAQHLRTILGERAYSAGLTGNVTKKEIGQLQDAVDRSIQSVRADPNNAGAIRLLNQVDSWYAKNIKKFNDGELNQLVARFKETGTPPDPSEVARMLIRNGETARASQVRQMLGPDLWKGVQSQDVENLLKDATDPLTGSIDGSGLASALFKRGKLMDAVHGPQESARMMEFARNLAAVQGKLPADAVSDPGFRALLEQSEKAQAEFDRFVKQDPIGALGAMKKTPKQVYAAITRPGDGALLKRVAMFLGPNSPEMRDLRETAVRRVIADSVFDYNSASESSQLIEKQLNKYSADQRKILFPKGMEESLRLFAKDIQFLMPRITDPAMAGMTAGALQQRFFIRRWYAQAMASAGRWIVDNPGFQSYLIGTRKPGGLAQGAQGATMQMARLFAADAQGDQDQQQ